MIKQSIYDIDYEMICLDDLNDSVDESEYINLKRIATKHRNYLNRNNAFYGNIIYDTLSYSALTIVYNSSIYSDKSNAAKSILSANIVFDDNKFAQYITNVTSYANLCVYLKKLKYLQVNRNKNVDSEYYIKCQNEVNKFSKDLVNYFSKIIARVSINIIINKINEIISFKPELLNNQAILDDDKEKTIRKKLVK